MACRTAHQSPRAFPSLREEKVLSRGQIRSPFEHLTKTECQPELERAAAAVHVQGRWVVSQLHVVHRWPLLTQINLEATGPLGVLKGSETG